MSRISATSTTPSRARAANSHYSVISRPRAQDDNGKLKSSCHDVKNDSGKNRRSMLLKRAKSGEEEATAVLAPQRARSVNRPAVVEQFGCPRRTISRKSEEAAMAAAAEEDEKRKKMEVLEEKLLVNESLIKDLQVQVLSLKTELEEARNSNAELELKNMKLSQDLVSAEAKISALSSNDKVTFHFSFVSIDLRKIRREKSHHCIDLVRLWNQDLHLVFSLILLLHTV